MKLLKRILSSSSRADSMDVPDCLSPPIPIIHRSEQVFQIIPYIRTEQK